MPKTVTIEVDIIDKTSDKAIHVVLSKTGKTLWIPRSVIVDDESEIQSDAGENDAGSLVIEGWFATKEGIGEE